MKRVVLVAVLGVATGADAQPLPGDRDWAGPSTIECWLGTSTFYWTDPDGTKRELPLGRRLETSVLDAFCIGDYGYVLTPSAVYGFPLKPIDDCDPGRDVCISGGQFHADLRRELRIGVVAAAHSTSKAYFLRRDGKISMVPFIDTDDPGGWVVDSGSGRVDAARMAFVDGCLVIASSTSLTLLDVADPEHVTRGGAILFGPGGGLAEPSFRRVGNRLYVGPRWRERTEVRFGPKCSPRLGGLSW